MVVVEQINALLDFLESHSDLAFGQYYRTKEGRSITKKLWAECATILNNVAPHEGLMKTGEEWRLYYNEFKYKTLRKIKEKQAEQNASGPSKIKLTINQDRLYKILGSGVLPPNNEEAPDPNNKMFDKNRLIVNQIHGYFTYDRETNTSRCSMENCGRLVMGNNGSTLSKHFKTHHIEEFRDIMRRNMANKVQEILNDANSSETLVARVSNKSMPLTSSEKTKRYREKLKNEYPEKYKEVQEKAKIRSARHYEKKKNTYTKEDKQNLRQKWKEDRRKARDQQKASQNEPSTSQASNSKQDKNQLISNLLRQVELLIQENAQLRSQEVNTPQQNLKEEPVELHIEDYDDNDPLKSSDDESEPPLKRTKNSMVVNLEQASSSQNTDVKQMNNYKPPEDKFDIFGKSVSRKLRNIAATDDRQRLMAEKIINDALFFAELGELTMTHCHRMSHD